MTSFTLWINHYHQIKSKGYHKSAVSVSEEEMHVQIFGQEFWLPLNDVVQYIMDNGQEVENAEVQA